MLAILLTACWSTTHSAPTLEGVAEAEEPFGDTLRRLRRRAGLTQEQLAERSGLSVKAISSLERGERRHPYPHTLRALGTALGLGSREHAALRSAVLPRGRRVALPAAPSALIGREGEVRAVADLMASGETRLLTLTGPGGVGKTRLALAGAQDLSQRFADGAAFVSLAPLDNAALVLPAIAQALDLHESRTRPLREIVHDFLRGRNMVLVIDNLEHLPEAGMEVAALLAAAPPLRVLATSRSPLRIQGERIYPVPPLAARPAEELFMERAVRAAPSAAGWDRSLVSEICRRLDGLPLAIELAAARARVLSAAALLDRLGRALSVLEHGARDLPARQQGLRQTIAWSHDLLDSAEKSMFRRLAVFAGGWTLEGAAGVGQVDEVTALALSTELLDASLITAETSGHQPRFGLLETVRAFAAERLDASGETGMARDRHAAHCRDLARTAGEQFWGPAQAMALDRLQTEHDNLRVAFAWLLKKEAVEDLADMGFSLWMFWWIRGHLAEGRHWAERALAHGGSLSLSGRAKLLFAAAFTLLPQGHYQEATKDLEEAARLARDAQDLPVLCWILTIRGYAAAVFQPESAAAMLAEAGALSRAVGNPHATLRAAVGRALVAFSHGRLTEADQILAECETAARAPGVPWSLALVVSNRGRVALELGEYARAEALLREGAALLGLLGDTGAVMSTFTHLADAAVLRSDPERAARLFGAADAVRERNGATLPVSHPFYRQLNRRCRAAAAEQLGPVTFEALHRQGRAMPLDRAVAFAVGPATPVGQGS